MVLEQIDKKVLELATQSDRDLEDIYNKIDNICMLNSNRILSAFINNKVSYTDFADINGYGNYDTGRDKLEAIFSTVLGTEDALVRPQIMSGTNAIYIAFTALLKPGDTMISITGQPYDSLQEMIGLSGNSTQSLKCSQIKYEQIDLIDNNFDINSKKLGYTKLTPEEMKSRGILGRLSGVVADSANATRNGRKYGRDLWEKTFSNTIVRETIDNRLCLGELGHPLDDRTETDIEKVCICLNGYPTIDDKGLLRATFDILDTPNGRILNTLARYGANIGVSSRGEGDLYTDANGDECVEASTYQFQCFDAVIIPAVETARMSYMTESLGQQLTEASRKHSLTEALHKEVDNANDNDKKIMLETLKQLGLTEGVDPVKSVIEHFGTVSEPPYNITYIMRDGSFLDLSTCAHHSDVEQWLVDNNLSKRDFNRQCGSPTLFDAGCIRVDMNKYCITLCDNQPKWAQYESLIKWLDELFAHTRIVTIVTPKGNEKDFSKQRCTADDVVDSIRKYYFTGELLESKVTDSPYRKPMKETYTVDRNEDGQFEVRNVDGNLVKAVNSKEAALTVATKLEYGEDNGPDVVQDDDEPLNRPEREVVNNESVMEELQEALSDNRRLSSQLMDVQKELSASNTREKEYEKQISQLKECIAKLSVNTKKVNGLETRVTQLSEALQKSTIRVNELEVKNNSANKDKANLSECISQQKSDLRSLNEQLDDARKQMIETENTLNEDLKKANGEITLLKEKYLINKTMILISHRWNTF